MTQNSNLNTSFSAISYRTVLNYSLGWLGGIGVLTGSVAFAQTAPTPDAGTVPSAEDLLSPSRQPEPAPSIAVPAPVPAEPMRSPVEASPTPAAETPSLSISDLEDTPQTPGNFDQLYIDSTDYSVGATRQDQPTVVFSERSTGCQTVVPQGQTAPRRICAGGAIAQDGSSINLGPLSVSSSGIGFRSTSPQDYYNLTQRPTALLGNGNSRLMFPLTIPAAVTSVFGWRIHPIFGGHRFHSGTDLAAPMGTPIVAAYSGRVVLADFLGGYGLTVVLQHGDEQQTLYGHMSEIFVRPGEEVAQGEAIGRVGSTGNSTGPHLHFEVRQRTADGWIALNPGSLLETALAGFSGDFQLAQAPTVLLDSLKDLSKASEVAGTAYTALQKQK